MGMPMIKDMLDGLRALPSHHRFTLVQTPGDVPCLLVGPYEICFAAGTYDIWEGGQPTHRMGLTADEVEAFMVEWWTPLRGAR